MASAKFAQDDFQKNRIVGGLGYLAFFIPLLACPGSRYGKFCANQGLMLLIAHAAAWLAFKILGWLLGWVPILGWVLGFADGLIHLALSLIAIYYFVQAIRGEVYRLPYVGDTTLIR